MDEIERLSNDLRLKVTLNDGDDLVTQTPPELHAPSWGMNVSLQGQREYSHIFRLPNKGGWIRKWVYSRGAEAELLPEAALDNSTTESTTLFRAIPAAGRVLPMMSSHWFLCPLQSCNGYTVGLAYMDVRMDKLDAYSVHPASCGRFAMDEATGEVFMTAWNERSLMTVGWTESVSSCERVRELFVFQAPATDGEPPGRLYLRNSFYERRDCRLCSGQLSPPCRAPAGRARMVSQPGSSNYLFPLQTTYRRFRGCYYGVVVKTVYRTTSAPSVMQVVPIVLDIRHGIATVARRLRINLREGAVSFGVDPRVSARMLVVDARRGITARFALALTEQERLSSASPSGTSSETSGESDAKRRRNADNVYDRDSVMHQRKVRNRVSAARTNEARKKRIAANKAELHELKTSKVPKLQLRLQELRFENNRLRELVDEQARLPDECIDPEGAIPLTGGGKYPSRTPLLYAADPDVLLGPLATSPMFEFNDDIF